MISRIFTHHLSRIFFALIILCSSFWNADLLAYDFDPNEDIYNFSIDKTRRIAKFTIICYNECDGANDDNLRYAEVQLNGVNYFDIIAKEWTGYGSSGYSTADMYFSLNDQDEDTWGVKYYAAVNVNATLSESSEFGRIDFEIELNESELFAESYTLSFSRLDFEDADEDYSGSCSKPPVAGWEPVTISGVSATDDNCSRVNITWDLESGFTRDLWYKIEKDGTRIVKEEGSTTNYSYDLGDPQPGSSSYKVTVGYGKNLVGGASGSDNGGPPSSGYDNAVSFTATSHTCDEIKLSWSAGSSSANVEGYNIYCPGREPISTSASETEYTIVSDISEKDYVFTIKSENQCGFESSGVTATSSHLPLNAPSGFTSWTSGNTIRLDWSETTNADQYVIKRSSSSGSTEIEISDPSETQYKDENLNGCETYTYQLFAANTCTAAKDITGIEAVNKREERLQPVLSSYIDFFDASKAYYPDKVLLEWKVEEDNLSLVDEFVIKRRRAGEGSFESLTSVTNQATFEDKSAMGGVLYEYQVIAKLQCESDVLSSNALQTIGFRKPYGMVFGNISYENGVNVKAAEVLAEKGTAGIGTSLRFNGTGSVNVPNESKLNPSGFIAVEAWIKPASVTGQGSIIRKSDGSLGYHLYQDARDIVFELNVENSLQTVRASGVLTLDEYTHVAGVYDSTGLKVFINGEVPYNIRYMLAEEDTAYLAAMNVNQEILSMMGSMVNKNYVLFEEFNSDLIAAVDSGQAARLLPLLTPVVTVKEKIAGTAIVPLTGSIIHSSGSLSIGNGFNGNIDEIRIWNAARNEEKMAYDFKRVAGNEEEGIAAYWRCDENFGTNIYDASKSNSIFHKNDGSFSGTVSWSSDIPNKTQLGWMGKTDEKGNYVIPYIPYMGSGENFTLTPRYEQHQFEANTRTIFLGKGSAILSEQDFTDVSSFKVTGKVFYKDTYCGVEGAMLGIDGEPVIRNGSPVYTDSYGNFEISVPVGDHFIAVEKSGHSFTSYKFPPGPESATFNFQEAMNGINFIDETTVTVTGRVVGGTREGDKKPGLGLSKNNIGIAEFTLESATGCTSYDVRTDSLTGEYTLNIPPMVYLIRDFDVPKNPAVMLYFSEFPEADFSVVSQPDTASHRFEGAVPAIITIDTLNRTASLDIEGEDSLYVIENIEIINDGRVARFFYGEDALQYTLDPDTSVTVIQDEFAGNGKTISTTYNYRYDLIYRTSPTVKVTAMDSISDFRGDRVIKYEDVVSKTMKKFNLDQYPFQYPVFTQQKDYSLLVHADEVYYNQDVCPGINGCPEAKADHVPVNDGEVMINNQLAIIVNPEPLNLTDGIALYSFKGGQPRILKDANFPWRDYSGVFNITVNIDDVGYEWKPFEHKDSLNFEYPLETLHPDDEYFRGYVLGVNPIEGSDFVTDGPQMVDMILRDPPGGESYSYIEKGSTFSYEEAYSVQSSNSASINTHISLGPTFELGTPLGGWAQEVEVVADVEFGISVSTSKGEEGSLNKEVTINDYWQTSADPALPGAPSDLFYGSSVNYVVSLADNLSIFPADFASDNGLPTAGSEAGPDGETYKIGLNKSLMMAPDGAATHFIYTADHIENYLIPNLISLRNNLFINNPKYSSNISIDNELYGSNNDDPAWGELATSPNAVSTVPADHDGPSYTFVPEKEEDKDMVRKYNQQIRLWEAALERNEMEKYYSELVKNISFDAGPTYEHSMESSLTRAHSTSFELDISTDLALSAGGFVGGLGAEVQTAIEINRSVGHTTTSTQTETNTFGYVLHDPDEGDYFSVDVKDPGTGTGPVFAIKGGRTMCPCEKSTEIDYFKPAKYNITESVISELAQLGANPSFLDVLSGSERTSKYTIEEIKAFLPVSELVEAVIPAEAEFLVPQIEDRLFKKRHELSGAFNDIVFLALNLDDETYGSLTEKNLSSMDNDALTELQGNMGTDPSSGNKIYLFSAENRDRWMEEYIRYRDYIFDISGEEDTNVEPLDASTLRREVPVASITPALRDNVPEDNKAYFTIQFGNASHTNETQWYEAKIVEASNPDGAVISLDGGNVNRGFLVDAGEYINKTISVEMGKDDVFEYNDLQIIFYSVCERDLVGKIVGAMDPEAIDTVTFSVHFVPSCTDIEIARPVDNFIINTEDEHLIDGVKETRVPILMTDYDVNNTVFEKLSFQFKSAANPDWIVSDYYHMVAEEDENEIPGDFTATEWDLSGYPDGEYNIIAKTYCGRTADGDEIFDLSEVWTGVVDRKPPRVFGSPQPADGILSPDDDIIIEFNEEIYSEKLNYLANFDVRGILNGTELRHDVSIGFADNTENFVRIPDGISLGGKSFTVEFWLKPERSHVNECFLSQSTNPADALIIGQNTDGHLFFQVGDAIYEAGGLSMGDIVNQWHHFAFIYDRIRNEAIIMMDGKAVGTGIMNTSYSGFGDIYLGKCLSGSPDPFMGKMHELRIWERPRTSSQLAANMLITLSGKETGLAGYWPFDDAYGSLAVDKVHSRNAGVNTSWSITPSGYAASFNASEQGIIDMNFSDVAFTPEQNFTIEFWFRSDKGSNTCFISNGRGDNDDLVLYYISPEGLYYIAHVLPLEDSVESKLQPIVNKIYSSEEDYLSDVEQYLGEGSSERYREQLLRFGKHMPTYWSINTDASGHIQVNNNGKRIRYADETFFDDDWHHFALVVERIGNTRMFIDGELKLSEPSSEWNGFGAARLFVGARGLFNQNLPGFEYDQYFDGSIDELRIWNTALKQTQIQRNSNMRLDGDELGLVAYLPFESYEELMGVPVINGTLTDMISERETNTNFGVFAQNTDVPNIRMTRPSSKVDFSFIPTKDQIFFVINEPVAKIENCILDITTKNVEDTHGNKMTSPVTWSAYVDMNQVKWAEQQFDLEKKIYEPLEFTATIRNSSGQQQNFSIENLPGWITAEPQMGTLEPLTEIQIVFSVSEGVNIGSYSRNIHLQTDFDFDEKLLVNLRVYENLPDDWTLDPADYENSMNIVGVISINNVISADKYDKVAAFVGDECRGMANLIYVEEYDMYEVFLDVYSNEVSGEYIEFYVWDASTGREFREAQVNSLKPAPENYPDMYEFIDNTVYGSPSNPVNIVAENTVIKKIPLASGWNWKSFNIEMDQSKPLLHLLEGINPSRGDMIKGLTCYSEFSDYWIGTLNFPLPEDMYMIRITGDDTLKVSGIPVDPENTPLSIVEGWNWIGYTPQVNMTTNEALGLFNPNHGDIIKSQFAFAIYDELMGWVGTLQFLKPNEGYKYKYLPVDGAPAQQQLFFPAEGTRLKSAEADGDGLEILKELHRYSNNMSVIAEIQNLPAEKQSQEDKLILKDAQNNPRGEAKPIGLNANGKPMYFITAMGNATEDTLYLTYIRNDEEPFAVNEFLSYRAGDVNGSLEEPLQLTVRINEEELTKPDFDKVSVYPNPFKDELFVDIRPVDNAGVRVEVLNLSGSYLYRKTFRTDRFIREKIPVSEYMPGFYILKITIDNQTRTEKIIKE